MNGVLTTEWWTIVTASPGWTSSGLCENTMFLTRPSAVGRENASMPSVPDAESYLEQDDVWHDFHDVFIPQVATAPGGQLRPRYIVKIDEHIYVRDVAGIAATEVGRAPRLCGTPLGKIRKRTRRRIGDWLAEAQHARPAPRNRS